MCFQWSFGILIWELFSYGAEPYDGIDDFFKFILNQDRLMPPKNTPAAM